MGEEYQSLMNFEIEELLEKENIGRVQKSMRIRWYDYVNRREEMLTLKLTRWKPYETCTKIDKK